MLCCRRVRSLLVVGHASQLRHHVQRPDSMRLLYAHPRPCDLPALNSASSPASSRVVRSPCVRLHAHASCCRFIPDVTSHLQWSFHPLPQTARLASLPANAASPPAPCDLNSTSSRSLFANVHYLDPHYLLSLPYHSISLCNNVFPAHLFGFMLSHRSCPLLLTSKRLADACASCARATFAALDVIPTNDNKTIGVLR